MPSRPTDPLARPQPTELEPAGTALGATPFDLKASLDVGAISTWEWDLATGLLYADRNMIELFTMPPEMSTGGPLSAFLPSIHPDDRDRTMDAINAIITAGGDEYDLEYRVIRPDGSYRFVFTRGKVIRDETGQAVRINGVVVDDTNRINAAEVSRRSEVRLRLATDSAGIGVYEWDAPTDTVRWENDRIYAIYGWPIERGPANAVDFAAQICHPDDVASFQAAITSAGQTGQYHHIGRVRRPDGSIRWIEMTGKMSFAADGSPQRMTGVVVDLTDEMLAAENLRASEARFRQLADAMPQIVWAARPDGHVDYFNQRWYDYTGMAHDLTGDASWVPVFHPDDIARTQASWTRSIQTGENYDLEHRLRRAADQTYRWHLSRALPIRDAEGQIIRWFGSNTDIHDQKLADQERARLLAEAEAASRMKDEFLATLSHELRTPLNAIIGWSKVLRSGKAEPEDFDEGLAAIERNGLIQAQLIEDLLDVSRIISGNLKLVVERLDVAEVIEAALTSVSAAANAKQIRVQKIFDTHVGPVTGDPARLQQVFWNLLTNAVKFTPKGGRVQVFLERVSSHIEVSVSDTGMGISPEFLPHVFDRFRQADSTTTRRFGGLGLGLSIVKHLTEMHGGSIRVKSPGEGAGTTFIVALPLTVIHEEPARSQPTRDEPGRSANPLAKNVVLAGLKVLVVDDEPDARNLVRRVLAGCKAVVVTAGSALEALEIVEQNRPDVIVSDVGMPGMDGYELIRRVRAKHPSRDLPAAALTAFARAEDRKKAMLAGFQTHVTKPVDPSELVAIVASLAGRTDSIE